MVDKKLIKGMAVIRERVGRKKVPVGFSTQEGALEFIHTLEENGLYAFSTHAILPGYGDYSWIIYVPKNRRIEAEKIYEEEYGSW